MKHKVFFQKGQKNSHEAKNTYKPVQNEAPIVLHKNFMKHKVFFQTGQKTLMKQKIHINQFKMKQILCSK